MVTILDNILPVTQKRATKLQLKYNWIQIVHDGIPQACQHKQQQRMAKFTAKANRQLRKSAFDACDKARYAACEMDQALQTYDVKAYLSHRKVQHKAAKQIFRAIRNGQDWAGAVESMGAANARQQAKRAQKVKSLENAKAAFLARHNSSDDSKYLALKAQLQAQRDALRAQLEAQLNAKCAAKQARLQKKMDLLSRRLSVASAKHAGSYEIPADSVLHVEGLKMYFSGLKAVDDLSFDVKQGEIFGLIGPNGAGKTTVFNCITQFYKPTGGKLLFRTRSGEIIQLTDYPVHDIILKGIARTFQNVEVVKEVSVLENLLIAATRQYTSSLATQMLHLPLLHREEKAIRAKAERILKYMDLSAYRDRLAWGLPYGVLKRIEIARVLMCNPQLVILDEPAAGLNESETRELAELINRIRKDFHCTILLVEHDMSLVMNICDHICAISFGKKLAYGTAAEIQSSKEVQEAYLGTGGA